MPTIEQLERKILELQNKLDERTGQMDQLLRKSEKALDQSLHAYRVDEYGFIWVYDPDTQKYHRTKMRVMTPEIADRAIHSRHIADGAVTGDKIENNEIVPGKLADDAVAERNIQPKAVTREKLSDELWELIGRTASNELLVAVRNETTYEDAMEAYESNNVIVGLDSGFYFLMTKYHDGVFFFTQITEDGSLKYVTLDSNGWGEATSNPLAEGDIVMDVVSVNNLIGDEPISDGSREIL